MNRTALLVVAVGLAGTLLVSSGAVPLLDGPADDIGENVQLYPSDSPDGKYAYIDDDSGELVVDISASNPNVDGPVGVDPDSVTTFEDVFHVRYNGSQSASVWLTHESDAITFRARDGAIESEPSGVVLGPNESVAVDVRVDTRGPVDAIRTDEMTVHARVAESSEGSGSEPDTSSVEIGSGLSGSEIDEPDTPGLIVTVTERTGGIRIVTAENMAPGATVDADLGEFYIVDDAVTLDGVRFDAATSGDANFTFGQQGAQSIPVNPVGTGSGVDTLGYFTLNHTVPDSAVENVTFQFSARWSYLEAKGIDAAEVRLLRYGTDGWTVLETRQQVGTADRARFVADSPGLSTFAVGVPTARFVTSEVTRSPASVQVGETATVTATVSNRGSVAGETTVSLTRNGSAVRTRTVALEAGETTTVRFDVRPTAPGPYAFAVDGVAAGTVVVDSAPATPTETVTPTSTPPSEEPATGQPPTETVPVGDEAAGFDVVALGGLIAVVSLVAAVAALRRLRSE